MGHDRAVDDEYLAGELRWRWRKAVEGAGISRTVWTPSGFTDSVPVVLRTQLRPFTRLTVRLRQGQGQDQRGHRRGGTGIQIGRCRREGALSGGYPFQLRW